MKKTLLRVDYHIDRQDRIAYVNPEWNNFARENDGGYLAGKTVIGTPLWNYISNVDTVRIYKKIVAKVRAEKAPVMIPYRCDSPRKRRYMEMTVLSDGNSHVEFRNELVREVDRAPIPLLDSNIPRTKGILFMCGWCKKVKMPAGWTETSEAVEMLDLLNKPVLPQISHILCNDCKKQLEKRFLM